MRHLARHAAQPQLAECGEYEVRFGYRPLDPAASRPPPEEGPRRQHPRRASCGTSATSSYAVRRPSGRPGRCQTNPDRRPDRAPEGQSAFDQAEGMPGRISEDPRSGLIVRLVIRLARTQIQQLGLGVVQVVPDVEADVKLLGNGLVRPARSSVVVDFLKADEKSVLTVETGEVGVRFRVRFEAGGLLIERRQSRMDQGNRVLSPPTSSAEAWDLRAGRWTFSKHTLRAVP